MREGLVADVLTNFSEDAPPVPLKLVVLAGAQQVEHDATETKFCELILHKGLISISVVFKLVHPSSVDFPFVRKSVHTESSENSARKGQQKSEGFHGARERRGKCV